MCNSVIISRLKALERYEIEADTIWDNKDGNVILWADIQAIIDEFEVKE